MKKVGRHAFQETSAHIIFIERDKIRLLKKSLHSSSSNDILICFS